jgi:hypothetical protein
LKATLQIMVRQTVRIGSVHIGDMKSIILSTWHGDSLGTKAYGYRNS